MNSAALQALGVLHPTTGAAELSAVAECAAGAAGVVQATSLVTVVLAADDDATPARKLAYENSLKILGALADVLLRRWRRAHRSWQRSA